MLINVGVENVGFFEALASEKRINILEILAEGDLNIKELATEREIIRVLNDSRDFWHPNHVYAQVLWLAQGNVKYKVPSYLTAHQRAEQIELSFEISSEAPRFNDNWLSDISIWFNGRNVCTWKSPGDFGLKPGMLTPSWWPSNQYGLLKTLRICTDGTFMEESRVSDVWICDVLKGDYGHLWSLRFEVAEDAANVGGMALFGEKFGNYTQNIRIRTFYEQ